MGSSYLEGPTLLVEVNEMPKSDVDLSAIAGLKTCFVFDWLTAMGGAEEVTRVLVDFLPGDVYTGQFNPAKFKWLDPSRVKTSWVDKMPLAHTKHYVYAPILPHVYRNFDLTAYDLVIVFSHTLAHNIRKVRPDARVVSYYCTPVRALWYPEIDRRASASPLTKPLVSHLKKLDLEASKRPDQAWAISQTAADRIVEIYKRPCDRVIFPPVDTAKFADVDRKGTDGGYLMWGRFIPYKRFDLAIDAAKKMGFKLNLVGTGPLEESLRERAAGHENIVFHGRLPDPDLKELMGRSKAVFFPTYEDFGIVPVEAMAAGLPVITYFKGGAAETVTPECGVHMQNLEVEDVCAAVEEAERREFSPETLRNNAERFSTDRFYREFADGLNDLVKNGRKKG